MSMNQPQQPAPLMVTDEMKAEVLTLLAHGVLTRTNRYGMYTGGFMKQLHMIEIWEHGQKFEHTKDYSLERITLVIDSLIRMGTGESPIKFFRKPINGVDMITYGLSKKGWMSLHELNEKGVSDFEVPQEAIDWANEPNVIPSPEQVALNLAQGSGGGKLQEIQEKNRQYREMMNKAKEDDSETKSDDETKEITDDQSMKEQAAASETVSGLSDDHPANTGEGQPNPTKSGPFANMFGKQK